MAVPSAQPPLQGVVQHLKITVCPADLPTNTLSHPGRPCWFRLDFGGIHRVPGVVNAVDLLLEACRGDARLKIVLDVPTHAVLRNQTPLSNHAWVCLFGRDDAGKKEYRNF
ncbi:hypothetical protein VTN00DRAFT_5925 [Thermoascus crustaceus]|uniref:uncharacterized protein n=1 Tax=Thermoascus crustaceus TaxID=5088 RepID=UPI00374234EF